jgi:hypothetical protein
MEPRCPDCYKEHLPTDYHDDEQNQWEGRLATAQAACNRLRESLETEHSARLEAEDLAAALRELVRAQDQMLICYRTGNFRKAGDIGDQIEAAREKVGK